MPARWARAPKFNSTLSALRFWEARRKRSEAEAFQRAPTGLAGYIAAEFFQRVSQASEDRSSAFVVFSRCCRYCPTALWPRDVALQTCSCARVPCSTTLSARWWPQRSQLAALFGCICQFVDSFLRAGVTEGARVSSNCKAGNTRTELYVCIRTYVCMHVCTCGYLDICRCISIYLPAASQLASRPPIDLHVDLPLLVPYSRSLSRRGFTTTLHKPTDK